MVHFPRSGQRRHRRVRRSVVLVALVASAISLSACGSDARAPSTSEVTASAAAPAAAGGSPSSTSTSTVTKVLTVVLENHGATSVRAGMPQLMTLADTYGQTADYRAAGRPSLPNYLVLAGGSTFGVTDNAPPDAHALPGASVFDLAIAAGKSARTYAEGMPTACALSNHGHYAVKHNPWAYFADDASRRACAVDDVPLGTLGSGRLTDDLAAGTLPEVGLIVPDMCNIAHDCPLATADAWLSAWIAQVQQGPDWRAGRLAVVVTFDEAEKGSDDTVLTVVAAPSLHAVVVDAPLTHLSWTRWMSDLVGSPAPHDARDAPSLGAAFGL